MKKSLLILAMILTGLVFIAASGQEIKPTDIKNLDLNRTTQETPPAGVLKPDLDFGKFPLYFITNKGQKDKKAVFYAKASRYTLWMTKEGLVFDSVRNTEPRIDRERRLMDPMARREDFRPRKFERSVSRLFFLNANLDPEMVPVRETEHRVNYFIGNDRSKWYGDVPTSQAVLYKELYSNIDCKVYGIERQVEYDWIVKPGGNPDDIRFEYREVNGTRIDEEGNLLIATQFGELMHKKPYSYQEINETERVEIDVTFKKIGENIYGFEVGDYDRSCELIIDPVVLAYSTYLGGRLDDVADGIALDNNGYVYVTGNISSADFPIKNSYKAYDGSSEIFVAKLDTTSSGASSLICSTIVGGSFIETGGGIAVDNSGYVYVIGETISTDFPIVNGYQTFSGGYFLFDIVLIKLDMTQSGVSSLVYSTCLGGDNHDWGNGIAVNNSGCAYIIGNTESTNFPILNEYQADPGDGNRDAFVSKIDTTRSGVSSLIYSTYLGGNGEDAGEAIAVGGSGYAYVTGYTTSTDYPCFNELKPYNGYIDGFITKIDTSQSGTSSLMYSTYFGGTDRELGFGIALDVNEIVYVTGVTGSTDFPSLNPYQSQYKGNGDAFVIKIDTTKNGNGSLIYSTYIGGSRAETGRGIVIGNDGYVYLAGDTYSLDYPTLNPYQTDTGDGKTDGFVTKLDVNQSGASCLIYSTYIGGGDYDYIKGIAVDNNGNAFITGEVYSTDFPTINQYQTYTGDGRLDAFLSKLVFASLPVVSTTSATAITATSAAGGGNVTSDGGALTTRGVCWSTSSNPTVSDSHTTDGTGTGIFTSSIAGLIPGTTYYVRAYATNSAGTSYGNEVSFTTSVPPNYIISGTVTDGTNPIAGATITFSHNGHTETTDADGNYSYSVPYGTTTIVTPSKTGYGPWSPTNRTFDNISANQTQDFTAGLTTFTISGTATDGVNPIPGVTITFSHDGHTETTDVNGNYSYPVTYGTSTTITPSKVGYGPWSPASQTFNNISTSQTQNFAAGLTTFTISGTTTNGVNPIPGVTVTFSHDGHTATTDANGNYSYTVTYGTSTTITPSKLGYGPWSPASQTFDNISANQTQNFTAGLTTFTISGTTTDGTNPIPGVTITFSHDGHVETTDANGNYSYTVTYGTSTTITPSKTGYGPWSPADQTFDNITANQTQNFTSGLTNFVISGTVTDASNPLTGVTITFSHDGHTETTNAAGYYSYIVNYGTSTTVSASKSGYTLTPGKYTYANISENKPNSNFSTVKDGDVFVTITSPKGGASVSGNVAISADVSSTKTISKVVFYIDGTQVNQDTTSPYQYNWDSSTVSNGSHTIKARAYDSDGKTGEHTITVFVHNGSGSETPTIVLSRTRLNYGAEHTGTSTGFQSFFISNGGDGMLNWTAAPSDSWILVDPGSGTGPGEVSVWIDTAWMSPGTYTGTISIDDPNASNSPQTVAVTLIIHKHKSTSGPFGQFSTPIDGSTVSSSIPVTGWVLDDIQVESVKIYRDNNVYVGDALFVEGARPDIESAYPTYPFEYRSGWGYMLLTNFLPNGGNGTYTLHAVAVDKEGKTITLGSKTIICDNANAVKPFGAIDTPLQGGAASGGSYRNNGWVLTPMPNKIPTDGSTIFVYVDGVKLGNVRYNIYREDIAGFFPGYANSGGAAGYFDLDTSAYADGVHTISWSAVDNAGNTDGIGSRYFSVQNSISQSSAGRGDLSWLAGADGTHRVSDIPVDYSSPVFVKQGYHGYVEPMETYPDNSGVITMAIGELERVEIWVGNENAPEVLYTGYQIAGERFLPLPVGSTLDEERGIFYWQPGPGFVGEYRFLFIEKDINGEFSRKYINILIR